MYSCRIFYDNSRHRLRHRPSPRNTNSWQHGPSSMMRRLVSHRSATVGQVSRTRLTTELVIDFSIFDLGGLTPRSKVTKGEMTYYPPRSTILQNFSPIAQAMFEIWATKVFQSLALIFDHSWSFKVKFDDANRKPVGPRYKFSWGPTSYLSPFSKYFDSKFWLLTFWPWPG